MNIKNIINFTKKMDKLFTKIIKLSKDKGFRLRKSKLNPIYFIRCLIQSQMEFKTPTLTNYCDTYEDMSGESITRTGFNKRIYNSSTIDFLKSFLKQLLEFSIDQMQCSPKLLKSFVDVYLLDCTVLQLYEGVKDSYKGMGGSLSPAGMKIQCLYNVFKKRYEEFFISGSAGINSSDQKYGKKILGNLKKGSLLLFDLGYINLSFIKELILNDIYFLSRYPHYYKMKLYNPANPDEKIDLSYTLMNNPRKVINMPVLIGNDRLPGRIIAYPMKKKVIEERQRKAKKSAKRDKRTLSQEHLDFLNYSIYFTNAPENLIKTKDAYLIYCLRWLIELIFKLWKSQLNFDYLSGKNVERIDFELFAKLITLTFYHLFNLPVLDINSTLEIELSDYVCITIFKRRMPDILKNLNKPKKLYDSITKYKKKVSILGVKSKSKNKKSTIDTLTKHAKGGYEVFKLNDFDIYLLCSQFRKNSISKRICGIHNAA